MVEVKMKLNDKNSLFEWINKYSWILGCLIVALYYVPYMVLGQNASVIAHDILDDQVYRSVIAGKYMFADKNAIIYDLMNGIPSSKVSGGIAYLCALMSPFAAYFLNDFIMRMAAYAGMVLLLDELLGKENRYIAVIAAVIYALLPFYSVYQLAAMGMPLVGYGFLLLLRKKKVWLGYITMAIYAYFSGLVLSGWVVAGMYFCAIIVLILARRINLHLIIGFAVLIAVYCLKSGDLISTYILHSNNSGYVSSITERVLGTGDQPMQTLLFMGHYHAISNQKYVLIYTIPVILLIPIFYKRFDVKERRISIILYSLVGLFVLTIIYLIIYRRIDELIQSWIPLLKGFNATRVYFIYPALWYTILGLDIYISICVIKRVKYRGIFVALEIAAILLCAKGAADSNQYKTNIKRLLKNDINISKYTIPSWKNFYSEKLFKEVAEYIGKPQSEYRVVSLGIYPAIASYNGFYCLDAYLVDYPLDYKHEFREVIAGELDKSEELKSYFDTWGNRCYLFSAELGKNYLYTKEKDKSVNRLDINTDKLYAMGGRYIISAVKIENSDELGLKLCKTFEDDGIWNIKLYEVCK